ncbi:MAG: hypothetical protein ACI4UI_05965 [Levilactobacillus brevis]
MGYPTYALSDYLIEEHLEKCIAKKVSLYGAAKTDPFTVDKAATKTKEGSLYYHVTDSKDSSISGWIYAGRVMTLLSLTVLNTP